MPEITLIRHAMPDRSASVAPRDWPLGPTGRKATTALARKLNLSHCHVVASGELKAVHTAQALVNVIGGGPAPSDPDFDEVHRPDHQVPNHPELAAAYLAGVRHPDWEDPAEVVARFQSGVTRHRRAAKDRRLVIVTHGMALTSWLTHIGRLGDPVEFWRGLRFPDSVDLEPDCQTGVE